MKENNDLKTRTGIGRKVMEQIIELARKNGIKKLILFGSRARGNYHRTSDIDLAVRGGDVINFTLDVDEKTDTVLMYDVVCLDGAVEEELLEAIEKEGVMLYEKV